MSVTADLQGDARDAAAEFLLAVADDDFVWGHRLSEWVALGPTMEEDNALAAMSQDEFGHARLFYEYVAEHLGSDLDRLALNRRAGERRNSTLVDRSIVRATSCRVVRQRFEVLTLTHGHRPRCPVVVPADGICDESFSGVVHRPSEPRRRC